MLFILLVLCVPTRISMVLTSKKTVREKTTGEGGDGVAQGAPARIQDPTGAFKFIWGTKRGARM